MSHVSFAKVALLGQQSFGMANFRWQAAGVLPESPEILLGSDFPEDASEVGWLGGWMRLADGVAMGSV